MSMLLLGLAKRAGRLVADTRIKLEYDGAAVYRSYRTLGKRRRFVINAEIAQSDIL